MLNQSLPRGAETKGQRPKVKVKKEEKREEKPIVKQLKPLVRYF